MIKSQLARKIAANLGTTDNIQSHGINHAFTAAGRDVVPAVDVVEVNNSLVNNGGVDNGEQASNSSEAEVQNALIRSASPAKSHDANVESAEVDAKAEEDTAADHMRKLLGDIVTHSRAAIKAGDDKVALAVTAYSWVS